MRVLFDNGVPRGVASGLPGHQVEEARDHGWDTLSNGGLLTAAESAGFMVLVTDRNIRYQQGRAISIVVLTKASWPMIQPRLGEIATAVAAATPGSFVEVDIPSG